MGATAANIWRVPAYLPYIQPRLTPDALSRAEERIGFPLPAEYVALLEEQNGGYIRYSLCHQVHSMIAGIGPHFPSLTDFDWDDDPDGVSFQLEGLVPFDGDGHWHLCLDYREDGRNPSITYIDKECDQQRQIARSFADYLSLLEIDVEGEYVLESVADVDVIKARLSSLLNVVFDTPSSYAHGYPIHAANLGIEGSPEWVWLSPNLVTRGFVREGDRRYAEVRDLLPGEALRFPELPESGYLLTVTDGARSRVLDACGGASVAVRPLSEYVN